MPTDGKTLEQRLAEFTEVHGTVLLGMHRELQTQLEWVNEVIAAAALEEHSNRIASIARQVSEDSECAKR